jgi:hypothetical protein
LAIGWIDIANLSFNLIWPTMQMKAAFPGVVVMQGSKRLAKVL